MRKIKVFIVAVLALAVCSASYAEWDEFQLRSLLDCNIDRENTLTDEDILVYDSSLLQWKNSTMSEALDTYYWKNDGTSTATGDWNIGSYIMSSRNSANFFAGAAYGMTGDGSTDDTTAFQDCIDACEAAGGGTILLSAWGQYKITDSLYLDHNATNFTYVIQGDGQGAVIYPVFATDKYIFHLNETSGGSKVLSYPAGPRLILKNVYVYGDDSTGKPSLIYYNEAGFATENIKCSGLDYFCNGEGYTDNVRIKGVYWTNPVAGSLGIVQGDHGDAWDISEISALDVDIVTLENAQGARIHDNVGGRYIFNNCRDVIMEGNHLEYSDNGAAITINDSDVTIRNNYLWDIYTYEPIYIDNDGNTPCHVTIENNTIVRNITTATTVGVDFLKINAIEENSTVRLTNNKHLLYSLTRLIYDNMGLTATATDGTLNTLLANNKRLLTGDVLLHNVAGTWALEGVNSDGSPNNATIAAYKTIANPTITVTEGTDYPGAIANTTTYYYTVAIYQGSYNTDNSAEVSETATGDNKSFAISTYTYANTVLRIWRGTSTGTYTAYIDIPCGEGTNIFYDTGSYIAGMAWIAAGVPSVPSANTCTGNVGIGTTSPSAKLDVNGAVYSTYGSGGRLSDDPVWKLSDLNAASQLWMLFTYGGDERFRIANSSLGVEFKTVDGRKFFIDSGDDLYFQVDGDTKLHIESDTGNVGIGTTSPGAELDVNGNTSTLADTSTDTSCFFAIFEASTGGEIKTDNGLGWNASTNALSLNGNLNLTNGSLAKISANDADIVIDLDDDNDGNQDFYVRDGTDQTLLKVEESTGNVGIGVSDPDEKLEVSGNIRLTTDGDKIEIGTDKDAAISYDGTHVQYNSQLVGAGGHQFTGNLGLGVAPNDSRVINAYRSYNDTSGTIYGMLFQPRIHPSSNSTAYLYGLSIAPQIVGSVDTYPTIGILSQPTVYHTAGTSLSLYGIYSNPQLTQNSAGTVQTFAGIYMADIGKHADSTETITNGYQIYLAELTKAASNWQLYNAGGRMHLGGDDDKIYIGNSNDCSVVFDNTNTIINPREEGTGNLIISSGELQGGTISDQFSYNLAADVLGVLGDLDLALLWLTPSDGGTEQDYSPANNDFTYDPDADWTASDQLYKGFCYELDFDGTNDRLYMGNDSDFDLGDGSNDQKVTIVVKAEVVNGADLQDIIGVWFDQWIWVLTADEKIQWYSRDASVGLVNSLTDGAVSTGDHILGVTYDGGGGATSMNGITFYVDGVAVAATASNDVSYVAMEASTTTTEIGANGANYPFLGDMGALFFVKGVEATATQMWQIYLLMKGAYNL